MTTVRPLQKVFPANRRAQLHENRNRAPQPFLLIRESFDDDEGDTEENDYAEVNYPQYRSVQMRPNIGEGSSKVVDKEFQHSRPPLLPRQVPPPLPYKPHHLRGEYIHTTDCLRVQPPPVPPRVVNREAIVKRKLLTAEYFENIKSMENNQQLTTNRSITIPGTETRPYWTIVDMRPECNLIGQSNAPQLKNPTATEHAIQENNDFIQSLRELKHAPWYWSDMTWEEAELMLSLQPDVEGLFLVRDSQDPHHILTLTARSIENTVHHIRIQYNDGKFHIYEAADNVSRGAVGYCRHSNVVQFVELAVKQSRSGTFIYFVKPKIMGQAPKQIRLLTPVSRFSKVKSLQHMSRLVIRNSVNRHQIDMLPLLPPHLLLYVQRSPYFDPKEDFPPHLWP